MPAQTVLRVGKWLLATRPARDAYVVAAASVAAMAALRAVLGLFFEQVVPFGTFFPALVLSAFVGGLGPGVFALIASATLSAAFFMPGPRDISGPDWVNLLVFLVSGGIIVALGVATRAARADRNRAQRLFGVVQEMALDGFVIYRAIRDPSGRIVDLERIFMNKAAEKMIGPASEMLGMRYLATSPASQRRHLFESYVKVLETGARSEEEFNFGDGERWVYNVAARVDDDTIAITFRDVTASRQTIDQQNLLLRELNHRVKNVLMMAMSLARLTSTEGGAVSYREALMARIAALGRAHDLLMTESWEGAGLDDLVSQTLAPYKRIQFGGDRVSISPETAISLNMSLHELATNAAKYGALSGSDGHVELRWLVLPGTEQARLEWRETGGPAVSPPTRQGLGSKLLKGGMAGSPMRIDLRFPPKGVECDIVFPISPPDTLHERSGAADITRDRRSPAA